MEIQIGAQVRVKPPFSLMYQDVYIVIEKSITDDGQDAYKLEGLESWFSPVFLEVVGEV